MKRLTVGLGIVGFLAVAFMAPGSAFGNGAEWEWMNPLPQGNILRSVWGSSATDVFAVGDGGAIVHYDGTSWSVMSSGTTQYLTSVWGSSPTDVFAVGWTGTILHYNGTGWSAMSSGTTSYLYGVWGSSATDVFAVGDGGAIVHYDGTGWSVMSSGTTQYLMGVWGSSPTDVFAVGWAGTILHYDGTSWSAMPSGTMDWFLGVWGSSSTDVFAVGHSGAIHHYDGTSWSPMFSNSGRYLYNVWGSSSTDVFAVGDEGTILHYDGTNWSALSSGTKLYLYGVWGSSATDIFIAGDWGYMFHYDGTTWSSMSSGATHHLQGVWGSSSTDVFAVGWTGAILHYDGTSWSEMSSGTTATLYGVWGSSATDVFAVGHSGTILHYDGTSWSGMTSGTTQSLQGVWGSSATDVFAVGKSGTILHFNGTDWTAMSSGTSEGLYGVWGSSATDVFAVGDTGTILHYDGTLWSAMSNGTTQYFRSVWGSSSTDVFAVGYPGTVLHYNGTSWSSMSGGVPQFLQSVWGRSSRDVFAVGYSGTILHYNGTSWSTMSSGMAHDLYGVWRSSETDVYAVGDGGAVLHYSPPVVAPTVTTKAATGITSGSATLNMSTTMGSYGSVDVRFAHKKASDSSWNHTDWVTKSAPGDHAETITGLDSVTLYDFKSQLSYNATVLDGETLQFQTSAVIPVPPAPDSITYPDTSTTGNYEVSWGASDGAASYTLERSEDGGTTWAEIHTGTDLTHAETLPNGSYRYRVRATNVVGNSDWKTGAFDCVVNIPVPPAPALVSPADNAAVAGAAIDFSWDAAAGADRYNVEVRRVSDDSLFKSEEPGDVTAYHMTGFPDDGTQYKWQVRAGNATGWGIWSASRTLINGSVPPVPDSITYPDTSTTGNYEVSWGASDGAASYTLERSEDGGTTWAEIHTGTDLTHAETLPNGAYRYRVRATNVVGNSDWRTGAQDCIVNIPPPAIGLNRTRLNFGSVITGPKTDNQVIVVSNAGGETLNWTAAGGAGWLGVAPASGSGTGTLTVSVNPAGLVAGTYNSQVTVTAPGAPNSPKAVDVSLNVYPQGSSTAPIGVFDTPTEGATVYGAIPVTGWALDDVQVQKVEIKRSPHANDPAVVIGPDGLVYISDATFVEGARPDVEAAFPQHPLQYRAGWGYMLLTNMLPNQGNDTFKIHAFVQDKEGTRVKLGEKTITGNNAASVKPFGAIDTPAQGGQIGGAAYNNFGWALTPLPNTIPFDGSTIHVWVNGVNLGNPVYNYARPSLAALFPGLNNTAGPVGLYVLDTTAYANGVHTIAWGVVDNGGNAEGIGSRFFSILNAGGAEIEEAAASAGSHGVRRMFSEIAAVPTAFREPVYMSKGYGMIRRPEPVAAGADGTVDIRIAEVERVELVLGMEAMERAVRSGRFSGRDNGAQSQTSVYVKQDKSVDKGSSSSMLSGYLVVGDELRPLPIGSTLDPAVGIFAWQPGPGFLGEYMFVFVRERRGGMMDKSFVRITIKPKF